MSGECPVARFGWHRRPACASRRLAGKRAGALLSGVISLTKCGLFGGARRVAEHNSRVGCATRVARLRRVFVAVWLPIIAISGYAAGPLKLELQALTPQPRPGAPEWVEARLSSTALQLVEGVLDLRVFDDSSHVLTLRTPELALTTGTRTFRLLLPAGARNLWGTDREVGARFHGREREVDLGRFPLHQRSRSGYSLVLGIVRGTHRGGEVAARRWQSLRPERFAAAGTVVPGPESLTTNPLFFESDDLPVDPLGFCALDAILLEPGTFAALKEKPLAALGTWLAAGGSVMLLGVESLDAAREEVLRGWLKADPTAPTVEAALAGSEPILVRVGLGRLVVLPRIPEDEAALDSREWRRAAAFLWKFRAEHARAIEGGGTWSGKLTLQQPGQPETYQHAQLPNELTQMLLPKNVRVIPLWLIVTILAAFIITVGPVDYFLLGKLRARRFTWILFPLVGVGFTVLMVMLASGYLGTNTHRGALILKDLAADGKVVRETHFEMVLPARPRELERDTRHAFAATLPSMNYRGERSAGPASFDGQFPARYTFRTPLQQWTPHLLRLTSFASGEDDSRVNWGAFTGEVHPVADRMVGESGCALVAVRSGATLLGPPGEISSEIFGRFTQSPNAGIFSLVSQLSPTGGASVDDLGMAEPLAAERTVVVAIRREGRDLHVWRRLYFIP